MLIVFLSENELFQGGWEVFVILVEIPEGCGGAISSPKKCKNGKSRKVGVGGGGVQSEIPSVVGVWILSGTTQWFFEGKII